MTKQIETYPKISATDGGYATMINGKVITAPNVNVLITRVRKTGKPK